MTRALDFCKGGLVNQHRNEMRNTLGDFAASSCREVFGNP